MTGLHKEDTGASATCTHAPSAMPRHIGLTVADIERSLRFWADGMGLEVAARQEQRAGYLEQITTEPGARALQAHLRFPGNDVQIELLQYLAPTDHHPISMRPRDPGSAHFAVTCNDLERLLERLLRAGGRQMGDLVVLDQGVNCGALAVYLRDPDQHIVELVQPPRAVPEQ